MFGITLSIEHTLTIKCDPALLATARDILAVLKLTEREIKVMAQELDDLTTEVAQVKTVEESAVTLIQGLAAQLAAAGTDPQKLADLRASLASSTDALAAAVAANTEPPAA